MTIKNLVSIFIVSALAVFCVIPSSWAGSPQSHRWEGVAIGVGAAILGKAFIDSHHSSYRPDPRPAPVYGHKPPRVEHYYYEKPEPAGHWETRKYWVEPAYKKTWNPGHYNRRGHWVEGGWVQLEVEPGYWVKKKVWVPHY
ncbi:MAG: hypothetical protein GY874_01200 [Desulfobacteraceae bacterium]|nr:hypothetical protein [Desulfobacteraceae bacterium]